jgi:hypothetical protein
MNITPRLVCLIVLSAISFPVSSAQGEKPVMPNYPIDDEVFTLALTKPITGLEMVRADGYKEWQQWKFVGQEIAAPQVKRFKLVTIGRCSDFEMVKTRLAARGKIPQGQWRDALKQAFPGAVSHGPIGVADASWVEPSPTMQFPSILDDGEAGFSHVIEMFDGTWRWLVEVE